MTPIPYAIIGIGGYGSQHLAALLRLQEEGLVILKAAAEPFPERHPDKIEDLKRRNVRHYMDWREMLDHESALEAVSIPAPIPLHVPMAVECFERQLNVVLEKPPAVLVQDVDRLIKCAVRNGVLCQVGFQNMTDPTAHKLKKLLLDGDIGDLQNITVFGAWKRLDSYYHRSGWAGKLKLNGDWVLDGPLNNPLCHYVHQALFFAGDQQGETARPERLRAELYRAHPIEGEDVACTTAVLHTGATLNCFLTTCAPANEPLEIRIKGSKGTATWGPGTYGIENDSGRYTESGENTGAFEVIKNFVSALKNRETLLSPLESTRNVILHNNACFKSSGRVYPIPPESVRRYPVSGRAGATDTATEVPGLVDNMQQAAAEGKLFSEIGIEWAKETEAIRCDFSRFNPGFLCD